MKNCPGKNLGERVHRQMKRRPVGGGAVWGPVQTRKAGDREYCVINTRVLFLVSGWRWSSVAKGW